MQQGRKNMGFLLLLQLLLIALGGAPYADAWGDEGHFMICKIAEPMFTWKTSKAVKDLLPESAGGHLASVCTWADDIRRQRRWSYPLHFVNTPGACNFDYSRDCYNERKEKNMCAVGAIYNFTEQLQTYGDPSNQYNLTESLMFLAHIVGDIHQPLHAGFRDDYGGNTIRVYWYQKFTNLHKVWDDNIIQTAMEEFYGNDLDIMTESIRKNISDGWADEIDDWESCGSGVACPDKYASESVRLACDYAYKGVEQNSTLGDEYFNSRLPVVRKRIAQAGVRLASVLNGIFDVGNGKRNPAVALGLSSKMEVILSS